MNKILAVVAHPDDEIIGVGGTLCKHVESGDEVKVVILGDGRSSKNMSYKKLSHVDVRESNLETSAALKVLGITKFHKEFLPDNRFDRMETLDLVKIVSSYIADFKPSVVYTHHFGDLNIDHRMCSEAVVTACRPIENPTVKEILMFETLSSTEMAGFIPKSIFLPNRFVDIEKQLNKKIDAMSKYESELKDYPHPRSLESIKINAKSWGTKVNLKAAEPFFVLREIV